MQSTAGDGLLHRHAGLEAGHVAVEPGHHLVELPQVAARRGLEVVDLVAPPHRVEEGEAARRGEGLQPLHGLLADAAGRAVHHPQQVEVGGGVEREPQPGRGVAHLGPLVEARAPDDDVGHPRRPQRRLHRARLRVHPVEHGDLVAARAPVALGLHRGGDALRLLVLVLGHEQRERRPGLAGRSRASSPGGGVAREMTAWAAASTLPVER